MACETCALCRVIDGGPMGFMHFCCYRPPMTMRGDDWFEDRKKVSPDDWCSEWRRREVGISDAPGV